MFGPQSHQGAPGDSPVRRGRFDSPGSQSQCAADSHRPHHRLCSNDQSPAGFGELGRRGLQCGFDDGAAGAVRYAGETNWQYRFYPTILWGAEGGDLAPTVSGSTDVDFLAFYTWNSTPAMVADVQIWLANPAANFGWALVGNEDQFPTVKRFDTREHVTPANRPKLIVTYLPPGSCTCLADVNGDSDRDARDIQAFVHCLLGSGTECGCTDVMEAV
jgi:hypothetical protein